jgi:hypothetical protein
MHSMLFSVVCPCAFDLNAHFLSFLSALLFNKISPTIHPQLASQPATVASCISQRLSVCLNRSLTRGTRRKKESKKQANQLQQQILQSLFPSLRVWIVQLGGSECLKNKKKILTNRGEFCFVF